MARLALLSLCLIGLASPVLAQATLTPDTASSSVAAPAGSDAMDQDLDPDGSSEEPMVVSGPPVASKDILKAFYDTCTDISGGNPEASDRANNAGWVPEETADTGPFRSVYAGARDFAGYGSVELWASVETYPSQQLGYCRVDFGDYNNLINFDDLSGMGGLIGKLDDRGDGNVYGAWETPDKKMLVIADRTEGEVEIEFNLLLGDTPAQQN